MTEFTEPHNPQYQIQYMREEFEVWETVGKHDNPTDAEDMAQKLANKNPDTEYQIVRVKQYNY